MQKINLIIFLVLSTTLLFCESNVIGKKEKIKVDLEKKVTTKKNKKYIIRRAQNFID